MFRKNGICLVFPDGKQKVYFELAILVGDNLGLHSILGFVESFNATIYCRRCLTKKCDINTIFSETICKLRDAENYKIFPCYTKYIS